MVKSQLYLYPALRKKFKIPIETFSSICQERIFIIFENIESEADEKSNKYYDNIMCNYYEEIVDPLSIAEDAFEHGLEHYLSLNLVRYNIIALSIVALYQIWEQSVKLFLFHEIHHTCEIEFSKYFNNIKEIKRGFEFHNYDITEMKCWEIIDELRLLCNTIKHGDGPSAKELLEKNSALFKKSISDELDIEFENTTLLAETLDISTDLFNTYSKALMDFWDELPERSFSDELL